MRFCYDMPEYARFSSYRAEYPGRKLALFRGCKTGFHDSSLRLVCEEIVGIAQLARAVDLYRPVRSSNLLAGVAFDSLSESRCLQLFHEIEDAVAWRARRK